MATDGAPAFGRGMTVSPLFCLSHRNCEWLPSTAATGPLEARRRRLITQPEPPNGSRMQGMLGLHFLD